MFGMGLNLTIRQISEPFRSTRLVLSALAANFVLVPLSAYLITKTITMDRSLAIGLLLLGTASGAPLFPKLVEFARGNVALAIGLMALLMAVTIAYMPLGVAGVFPGCAHPRVVYCEATSNGGAPATRCGTVSSSLSRSDR